MPVTRSVPPRVAKLRARLAVQVRDGHLDAAAATRAELSAANVEAAARRVADRLPPLTAEQRGRIATLLAPALAGVEVGGAASRRDAE